MALDFEVQRFTRRCHQTDRELTPGETFYSALFDEPSGVVRRDYAADAWEGPPEDAVSSWKSQVPAQTSTKVNWAPNDVMMHYFEKLENDAEKADFRYVLTLLMIRRRILQFETADTMGALTDADESPGGAVEDISASGLSAGDAALQTETTGESSTGESTTGAASGEDAAVETMMVYFPRKDSMHRVIVADPTPERIDQIQEELARLFCSTGS